MLYVVCAANPFILNDENETAHDIARRSGYVGVVRAIEVNWHSLVRIYSLQSGSK
jgi:hypothetical protein